MGSRLVVLVVSMLLLASPAGALMVGDDFAKIETGDAGATFSIAWSANFAAVPYTLSARADFEVVSVSDTTIILDIDFFNTTVPTGGPAGISGFGISVTPDATASFVSEGQVFDEIGSGNGPNQTFPGGYKNIDVCVYAQNCSGGSQNQILAAGADDSFSIQLSGDFSSGETWLFQFPVKFQTDFGSFEFGPGANPIPEPSAALAFAVGLLVLRGRLRRA